MKISYNKHSGSGVIYHPFCGKDAGVINTTTLIFTFIFLAIGVVTVLLARYGQATIYHGNLDVGTASHVPDMDFDGHVQAGNALFYQYRYADALNHYVAAVKMNDKDKGLFFRIGKIFQQMENYSRAEVAFKKVLELAPSATEAMYELARMYYKQAKPTVALKMINTLLAYNPVDKEALQLKARILIEQKEFTEVITVLQTLLRDDPDNIELQFLLAKSFYYNKNYEDVLNLMQSLCQVEPTDRRNAKFYMYKVYEDSAMHDQAIEVLQDILNTGTGTISHPEIVTRLGYCWVKKAEAFEQMNKVQDAIECYQKAMSINPAGRDIYEGLGRLYLAQNNKTEALTFFLKAIDLGASDSSIFYEVALIYDHLREFESAIQFMHKAARRKPTAQIYYHLGTFYGLNGDLESSINYLQKAILKDPEFIDAYYNMGVAMEHVGNKKEALRAYKKVLAIDKTHQEAKANFDALRKKGLK